MGQVGHGGLESNIISLLLAEVAVAALASIVSMTEIDKGVATCLPRT